MADIPAPANAPARAPAPVGKPAVAPVTSAPAASKPPASKEARGIIRLLGKDFTGGMTLGRVLPRLRGIGRNLANSIARAIERELKLPTSTHVGNLTDAQLLAIEAILKNPSSHGVLPFLTNHKRDPDTGANKHLVQNDLQFGLRTDIERKKTIRSWEGWRHSLGQKVRGQHNRTTGRTGMTVGVLKKAIKSQKEAASKGAQEAGKKEEPKK